MPTESVGHFDPLAEDSGLEWERPEGAPEGVYALVLHRHEDGSYTRLLRVEADVEFPEPVVHDFHEEVYYLEGGLVDTKRNRAIRKGMYAYHRPGEEHGPFKCEVGCLVLEFRYYK